MEKEYADRHRNDILSKTNLEVEVARLRLENTQFRSAADQMHQNENVLLEEL